MGFRRDDGSLLASDKTLTLEIQQMDINTVQLKDSDGGELWAEFSNVAVACAKRVLIAAQISQSGANDEAGMMDEFDIAEKIESKASGRSLTGRKMAGMEAKLNAKQYFAAMKIAFAFRSLKFKEKVRQRVTMQTQRID